jgi:hypothetical protein
MAESNAPPPKNKTIPWFQNPQHRYALLNANVVDPVKGMILENASIHLYEGIVQSVNGNV